MGIRKQGERVKGTTRVSFGDRKLMTRLWIADKTSRYEKRRTTRQLNKKEKESLEQCPLHRAHKGFQSFMKEARTPAKEFEVPEDAEDQVSLETMSHMVWYELIQRHADLQDDTQILELFIRDFKRDSRSSSSSSSSTSIAKKDGALKRDQEFVDLLFADMGHENTLVEEDEDDSDSRLLPSGHKTGQKQVTLPLRQDVERLVRLVQAISNNDDSAMPLMMGRRNMRLMHQYRRLTKRLNHSADILTATSAQVLVGHLYHSSAATSVASKSQQFAFSEPKSTSVDSNSSSTIVGKRRNVEAQEIFDYDEFSYGFDVGGIQSTDALWPLMDGSASSTRLSFQPKQWKAVGDSVITEIAQIKDGAALDARSSSAYYSHSNRQMKRRRTSSFSTSVPLSSVDRRNSSSESASAVLGFGFEDEERHRRHLKSEQRRNNIAFSHSYEMERQESAWTTCQRCREPVHTCDMVVRESIGIEDVACFHPECLTAVVEARASRKRQETIEDRENNAEVRSLTAIRASQEKKNQIRLQVHKKNTKGIVKYQRERQRFLSAREKSLFTSETNEISCGDTNNNNNNNKNKANSTKQMTSTMDKIMQQIVGGRYC